MGKFRIQIEDIAKDQLRKIYKSGDKATIKKLEKILLELEEHPKTAIGEPEALKYQLTGYWSRKINKKDRMIYEISEELVLVSIIELSSHYGDK
ncbi:Txe/YoeB family addiction module toxin [Flavobacterium psychrotolerans]|uniref:Putative mRNA interferase YoeB n=1 Tax=Flavobacterium psychrotolerans TaxID=2169410 RepID=A0A2U1JFI0_9FLAO|nr:Txe/YoeB family addiction module toxin [Flavobacterium psychrotolerans]PWA03866.1 Txe/YoeB family addiction module toxin [Flavobacterium psychrotolerans]